VILDEIHSVWPSKRGDLLALDLARIATFAPGCRRVGLSATVDDPDIIRRWLSPTANARTSIWSAARPGRRRWWTCCCAKARFPGPPYRPPCDGRGLRRDPRARTTLVFVNTRFQAEFAFQELWRLNEENLAIALHHGSLAPEQRRRVEAR